jgi:hypothetical protein
MAFIFRVKISRERNQLVPDGCKLCIKPVRGLDNYKFVDLATFRKPTAAMREENSSVSGADVLT